MIKNIWAQGRLTLENFKRQRPSMTEATKKDIAWVQSILTLAEKENAELAALKEKLKRLEATNSNQVSTDLPSAGKTA